VKEMNLNIKINDKNYNVKIDTNKSKGDELYLEVNGKPLVAKIMTPKVEIPESTSVKMQISESASKSKEIQSVKSQSEEKKSEIPKENGKISAPIPGTVVKISVSPGQNFKKGDEIISLETMKMIIPILAPSDGIVDSIHVKAGETVTVNQVMILFTPM